MSNPVTADQFESEAVRWLWPIQKPGQRLGSLDGRIARSMLHLLAGPSERGKSLVAVTIGAELIKAGYNVLHNAIEDSPALITRPRYQAAGVTSKEQMKRLHLWRFRLPERQKEFEQYVVENEIHYIVMDPLASCLSHGVSRHSDNIRTVTDPLTSFIETTPTRPAVVIIDHTNKKVSKNVDPLAAIGGSGSGLPAAVRMAFLAGVDPDSEDGDRILAHIKGSICSRRPALRFNLDTTEVMVNKFDEDTGEVVQEGDDLPYLLLDDECIFDPIRLLVNDGNSKMGRPGDKREAACEALSNYLFTAHTQGLPKTSQFDEVKPGNPVPAGRVLEDMKQLGIPEKTLRRAKAEMNVVINPVGGGRNAKWSLPSEILDLLTGGDAAPEHVDPEVRGVDPQKESQLDPSSPDFDRELAQLLEEMSDPSIENADEVDSEA